ncbi:hypothetical protein [Desulfovibrio inopinatus]|uniref:hypothetical protein n=1 Tax=Desulfovibrio inopinatus TaxID=102109 RepID=UPI0003FD328F|nr:hypothetical protein [Desulfovibrio inopinatus]
MQEDMSLARPWYNVPVRLISSYAEQSCVLRGHTVTELIEGMPHINSQKLIGLELAGFDHDLADFVPIPDGVPVEIVAGLQDEPAKLYDLAQLTASRPVRVRLNCIPGFVSGLSIAASLDMAVALEIPLSGTAGAEELVAGLELALYRRSLTQPIDFYHGLLHTCYHQTPVDLFDIQEENPATSRYITDTGLETVSSRLAWILTERQVKPQDLFAYRDEQIEKYAPACFECEHGPVCRGYFKWHDPTADCSAFHSLFDVILDAAEQLAEDVRHAQDDVDSASH